MTDVCVGAASVVDVRGEHVHLRQRVRHAAIDVKVVVLDDAVVLRVLLVGDEFGGTKPPVRALPRNPARADSFRVARTAASTAMLLRLLGRSRTFSTIA